MSDYSSGDHVLQIVTSERDTDSGLFYMKGHCSCLSTASVFSAFGDDAYDAGSRIRDAHQSHKDAVLTRSQGERGNPSATC